MKPKPKVSLKHVFHAYMCSVFQKLHVHTVRRRIKKKEFTWVIMGSGYLSAHLPLATLSANYYLPPVPMKL